MPFCFPFFFFWGGGGGVLSSFLAFLFFVLARCLFQCGRAGFNFKQDYKDFLVSGFQGSGVYDGAVGVM